MRAACFAREQLDISSLVCEDGRRAYALMMSSTIAAIATPPGAGALGIVRMSGPRAGEVLRACTGCLPEARRATLVRVRDARGHVLDECVATYFAGPASFTGEDVVELCCHGGALVLQLVLERLLACGARPAEPGEFSRRAFENGRMDLTQAEAVMDIISAGSELALRAAQNQLQGAIYRPVQEAIDRLLDAAAHIEAYIDFPEEDIDPRSAAHLGAEIEEVQLSLQRLLSTAEQGRYLREGVRTAIVGAPNVGKSSLLNRLLGYERAIVSPAAGTTRDTVEAAVTLAGLRLCLIDTAGLHESSDAIEQCGMDRSLRAWQEADLVLQVADASRAPEPLPTVSSQVPHLLLLNKADLPEHPAWHSSGGIRISCMSGQGFPELQAAIAELFLLPPAEQDSLAAVNTRHRYALQQALDSLSATRAALQASTAPELISVDLRAALDSLSAITGRVDTEDILTRIFSTFCLGK